MTQPVMPQSQMLVGDPTAVMGKRIGAFFIDAVIAIIVGLLIFFAFAEQHSVGEALQLPGCGLDFDSDNVTCDNRQVVQIGDTVYEAEGGPTFGFDLLFAVLYFAVLPAITGATLGKMATGVRIVNPDGSIVTFGRSLVRWIFFLVDGPFSLFIAGLATSLSSRGHRRVGDMVAGTYVVGAEWVGRPVVINSTPGAYAAAPAPPGPQWDATRGVYVQWDPAQGRYLTWDQTSQTWR